MNASVTADDQGGWDSGFPTLIAQMPVATALFDCRMNYLAASELWLRAYGRNHPDLIGKNYYEVHPATPTKWRQVHQDILLRGELQSGEASWQKSDGSEHWVKWSAKPWRDLEGKVGGLILVAEDITPQRQAQQAMRGAAELAERASRLLHEAIRSIPQGFVVYDQDDRLLICNRTYRDCYPRSRHLMVPGASFGEIVRVGAECGQYPQAQGRIDEWVAERIAMHRRADGKPFEQQLDDGRWLLVMEIRTPSGCVVGNRIDITERKRAEEQLRRSAAVIDSVQEGIAITDQHAVIQEVNPAFTRITEYSADELRGQSIRILQSGRHEPAFYQRFWDSLRATGSWQGEIWNRRKGGEIYLEWLSVSAIYDAHGYVTNYVGISTDLSRMQHAQTELERLAHHDPLTKLPNRLLLMSRLEHAVDRSRRYDGLGAVVFVDLDRFKEVNDRLGHRAGDELLQLAAQRMRERLRDTDTLARLGGDEFVIVLEEVCDRAAAAAVAQGLIAQIETAFQLSDGAVAQIGASVGIALFPGDGTCPEDLLERADQALYAVKRQGRGRLKFWGDLPVTKPPFTEEYDRHCSLHEAPACSLI